MTEAEAAEFLQVSRRCLEEERKRGRITPYRIVGNRIRYTVSMLQEYMRSHPLNRQDGTSPAA